MRIPDARQEALEKTLKLARALRKGGMFGVEQFKNARFVPGWGVTRGPYSSWIVDTVARKSIHLPDLETTRDFLREHWLPVAAAHIRKLNKETNAGFDIDGLLSDESRVLEQEIERLLEENEQLKNENHLLMDRLAAEKQRRERLQKFLADE